MGDSPKLILFHSFFTMLTKPSCFSHDNSTRSALYFRDVPEHRSQVKLGYDPNLIVLEA
jgi:hypothetical protein